MSPSTASWHSSHFFPLLTAHGLFLLSLLVSFPALELTSLCTSKVFWFSFSILACFLPLLPLQATYHRDQWYPAGSPRGAQLSLSDTSSPAAGQQR